MDGFFDFLGIIVLFGALIAILGGIDAKKASDATKKTPLEPCFRCGPGTSHLVRKTKDDWQVRCIGCGTATAPTVLAEEAIYNWNRVNNALAGKPVAKQPE